MLSKKMADALNEQIQKEFYSSYLYLAMAAHFEAESLGGFAHWMRLQSQEEWSHGLKLFNHVLDRGGRMELRAIEKPTGEWKSPQAVFDAVLAHEQFVTASIHKLYEVALQEKDYAAQVELQWFINEQIEEEKDSSEIVEQLKMIEGRGSALLMLDKQLGKRGKD
jgi:ferritin